MKMEGKIRWGILGTGHIAKTFAKALQFLPGADLVAVGSRAAETAKNFADVFNVRHQHPGYEQLAKDPEVDVVYIATPHPLHRENTILCLKAGKAVLCEKPFAINASQALQMIDVARAEKLFVMEAMWTRFLPLIVKIRQWIREGLIGQVRLLRVDFGFDGGFSPDSRGLNPQLGGGALLDVGVYTISLASMVFGQPPARITGMAHLGRTGVDEQSAIILGYDNGQLAVLTCAVQIETAKEAVIYGTKGAIRIEPEFFCPTRAILSIQGKDEQIIKMPLEGNGYNYEAEEVMRCLRAGKLESDIMPLDETLSIVKTMDEIRAQWGLKYPME
jgi:predicted dehydrogenase